MLPKFKNREVRLTAFHRLGCPDNWRAAAYEVTGEAHIRYSILFNTSKRDVLTLNLGLQDTDESCRTLAQTRCLLEGISNADLRGVDSTQKGRMGRRMGYLSTVIVDAIVLVVVLLLFSKVTTTFERLVVSLLVCVHLEVTGVAAEFSRTQQNLSLSLDAEFRRLRAIAGQELSADDRVEQAIQTRQLDRDVRTRQVKVYIHWAFQAIMWMAVGFNLLRAVL